MSTVHGFKLKSYPRLDRIEYIPIVGPLDPETVRDYNAQRACTPERVLALAVIEDAIQVFARLEDSSRSRDAEQREYEETRRWLLSENTEPCSLRWWASLAFRDRSPDGVVETIQGWARGQG